jgi:hypothetical protein
VEEIMKTMFQVVMAAALFGLGAQTVGAQEALLEPRKDESLFGPYSLSQTVQGVPLSTQASAFLSLLPEGDALRINVRVVPDLSDLQQKIGTLVDTISLPADNCAHFSLDNIVARIWGKQITVSGNVATLKLNGDVDVWTCLENPVPCTKVEWDGIVPRLITYGCNPPIKNRNVNQPFEATLPFRLVVVDPQTVAVELGDPNVNLGGALGGVTGKILKIAGVEINSRVKEALSQAINPDLLKASLPEDLRQFDSTITRAELLNNSSALAATFEMSTVVDGEGLARLVLLLQQGGPGSQ